MNHCFPVLHASINYIGLPLECVFHRMCILEWFIKLYCHLPAMDGDGQFHIPASKSPKITTGVRVKEWCLTTDFKKNCARVRLTSVSSVALPIPSTKLKLVSGISAGRESATHFPIGVLLIFGKHA